MHVLFACKFTDVCVVPEEAKGQKRALDPLRPE